MEIRISFTLVPTSQGWQFQPIQYLKTYVIAEEANLDVLKGVLQVVMEYAEEKLKPFKDVSKDKAVIAMLQAIFKILQMLKKPKK